MDFWSEFWPQFWASIASGLTLALMTAIVTFFSRKRIFRALRKHMNASQNISD